MKLKDISIKKSIDELCYVKGVLHDKGSHKGKPDIKRLCELAGINNNVLHNIRSRNEGISYVILDKLCAAFSVKHSEFLMLGVKND